MSTDYGRFGITVPDDSDAPNGPANFRSAVDDLTARLGYAGAQGGKSVVATAQGRTNTAYGLLGTPDRVSGLVVPADGDWIFILFDALVKTSAGGGRAAIFLDGTPGGGSLNQLKVTDLGSPGNPGNEAAVIASTLYERVVSDPIGLIASGSAGGATDNLHVGTGTAIGIAGRNAATIPIAYEVSGSAQTRNDPNPGVGGICAVQVDAGTYDVSVQYKASSGTITAQQRRLAVWTKEFPASGI